MKKRVHELQEECLSEEEEEDSFSREDDVEYLRKLERMKKMEEFKKQTQRDIDAEDEEPNILKPKLEKLIRRKLPQNRDIRCDDTSAVVSVTGRSERDLTKRFNDLDIDWSVILKQLLKWSELFRSGKKLRVDLCSVM